MKTNIRKLISTLCLLTTLAAQTASGFYDPNLQRWLTPDPIGEAGGINLYQFVRNDPVNRVDPWGFDNIYAATAGQNAPVNLIFSMPRSGGPVDVYHGGTDYLLAVLPIQFNPVVGLLMTPSAILDDISTARDRNEQAVERWGAGLRASGNLLLLGTPCGRMFGVPSRGSLSVETGANQAAFWSGRQGVNRSAAEASGLTTLEKTPAGIALEGENLFAKLPYAEAVMPWELLAERFAREAKGSVNAWTGGASTRSVWNRIELPILLQNSKVTKILIQDATQPWKTKIIYK